MEHTVAAHRDFIIREGSIGDYMYVIEIGEVDVLKSNGGHTDDMKLGRLGKHGFFGELAVLRRERMAYSRSVRARHFCRLAILSKTALDTLRQHNPTLDEHLNSFSDRRESRDRAGSGAVPGGSGSEMESRDLMVTERIAGVERAVHVQRREFTEHAAGMERQMKLQMELTQRLAEQLTEVASSLSHVRGGLLAPVGGQEARAAP